MNDNLKTNISLEENEAFGSPHYEVVRAFLYMVDVNMMTALERPIFSTQKCFVTHKKEYPMCAKFGENHLIFLSTRDNYWCQWVYQFAHEYCHHLINGQLSGDWSTMLWFEETLCELSSLYNIHIMVDFCVTHGLPNYAPCVQQYLDTLLFENKDVYKLSEEGGWYKNYAESLSTAPYKRELYNAIAALIYPLFIENPKLWKLIQHIGDIRSWASLNVLFEHLQYTADTSYADSLRKLRGMFT